MSSKGDGADVTAAEKRGYQRGYAAGRKRTEADERMRVERLADSRRRDQFYCAAMTGMLASHARWRFVDAHWRTVQDYANGAGQMADAMLDNAKMADRRR